jgi:NitT/TauT family transport system ATP-binding protein
LHALWCRTGLTAVFVTHSIPEAVYLSSRIVVMSPRPGRIMTVIDCDLPTAEDGLRDLAVRESPAFIAVARRVRDALRDGHSYDE